MSNNNDKDKKVNRTISLIKNEKQLEKGLVYGIVYEPDMVDTDGDYATAEEIEKAAHNFLPQAEINIEHKNNNPDISVVESYIAPINFSLEGSDQIVKKGSWVLVTKIHDEELRKSIIKENWTGYSMEGTALHVEDAA